MSKDTKKMYETKVVEQVILSRIARADFLRNDVLCPKIGLKKKIKT